MVSYMMPGQVPYGTIRLSTSDASYLFEVEGGVQYQNLVSFQRKFTIGDPTRDSDDLVSTWITFRDVTGGGQVYEINESSDINRYWYSTLRTTEANYVSLNRETVTYTDVDYILGDRKANDRLYGAKETDLFVWDETTDTWTDTTYNLASTPVNLACNFKGTGSERFYIPLGGSGIDAFDGSSITHIATPSNALFKWSNKLYSLGNDGVLYSTTDGATWAQDGLDAYIDGTEDGKHLLAFYNRSDREVLYAVTERAAYAYDEDVEKFYEVLSFPPHPGNSKGADKFRDSLYTASGLMIYFFNGGVKGELGPSRRDGLPAQYRGQVQDLRGGHNALYALIRGSTSTVADPDNIMQQPVTFDEGITFSSSSAYSSVMAWTELGWHTLWTSTAEGAAPNRIVVSGAQNGYRLWWDAAGQVYTQLLEVDFHNPLQGMQAGIDRFALSGYIESGWFDAAMEGFHKLGSHLEVSLESAATGQPVVVKYMTDNDTTWTTLGDPLTAKGKHVLPFNVDANGFSRGLHFEKIRLRIEMSTDDALASPFLRHVGLYFIKEPKESAAWTVSVQFNEDSAPALGWASALDMKQTLDQLLESEEFLVMEHLQTQYRVRIGAVPLGEDDAGQDVNSGFRRISIVEVKLPESDLVEVA